MREKHKITDQLNSWRTTTMWDSGSTSSSPGGLLWRYHPRNTNLTPFQTAEQMYRSLHFPADGKHSSSGYTRIPTAQHACRALRAGHRVMTILESELHLHVRFMPLTNVHYFWELTAQISNGKKFWEGTGAENRTNIKALSAQNTWISWRRLHHVPCDCMIKQLTLSQLT